MISIVAYSSSGLPSTIRDAIAKRADMSLVREATGHHEALNLVKYLRPAILLFSADAPNQDSRAIRFMLRSRVKRGTRGVAIVNSEDDALRAIRLGCSGTVTADATAEAVVECLNKVHDGETWLDPLTSMVLVRQIVSSRDEDDEGGHAWSHPSEATALTRMQRQIVLAMGAMAGRARRAEEASRAKSRVLTAMSHDLRILLNSIMGFSELALKGVAGPVNDKQKEFLEDGLICGRELREAINGILDLAKVEAGKMEVNVERLDPSELIRNEVVGAMKSTAILKGLSLEMVGSVGEVFTDSRKLKHIIVNFVSNAIQYSPPGGKITIRILPKSENAFSIEVEDQGPGIGSEKIRLLFNRFQQVDASAPAGSTGLGLALAKELAGLLGGRVGVNSVVGQGSSFYVVLPIHGPLVQAQPEKSYPGGTQPRILVVEDESADRMFLRRALARKGYQVDSSASLADAIRKCKTVHYDAITLDLALGDDDGAALLEELGSFNQRTPIIVVSRTEELPRYCQNRVYAQLPKPIEASGLFELLHSAGVLPNRKQHGKRQPAGTGLEGPAEVGNGDASNLRAIPGRDPAEC